jgi:predicted pyridoxine 5'-phosphate oxidase superfamily flavin-nucleotide-binding protein
VTADAFHEGERTLQERTGVRERLARVGLQVLRHAMPEQHRAFFRQLPFVVVGSLDAEGQPWGSMLAGLPGFIESPDPRLLRIRALPFAGSPLAQAMQPGAPLGLLGIEPHTRRRNRVNGVVTAVTHEGFEVEVRQSFGNCPKYIQARKPEFVAGRSIGDTRHGSALTADEIALIRRADTVFIASAHPRARDDDDRAHGVDVSHRGGKPGFVRVNGDAVLTMPDFVGNSFFNTLGNLALHPQAGLVVPDFDTGDVLHLTARATVLWEGDEVTSFAGAERVLRLEVVATCFVEIALPLRWSAPELARDLAATGAW